MPSWKVGVTSGPIITIGCDPEVFLKSKVTGKVVSAHDLLPGTKKAPHDIGFGAIQVDGVAAEFNTLPCSTSAEWVANLKQVKGALQSFAPGHDLQIIPAYEFDEEYFKTIPVDSRSLGCDPDYNAWTQAQNPPPDGGTTTLRTAAGHIHTGGWAKVDDLYSEVHFMDCCSIAKQMDYYLGMYTLLWDTDARRRTLYGKAGSFRPKTYGLEYRTPSNVWLRYDALHGWVWQAAYNAVKSMLTGKTRMYEIYGDLARQVIDNNDIAFVKSQEFKRIHVQMGQYWPKW